MFFNNSVPSYSATPKPLKIIIALSVGLTLLSSIVKSLIPLLGLSIMGISSGQYWQIFSFTLLQPEVGTINFSSIFHLFLYVTAIWIAGNEIIKKKNSLTFITLCLGSSVVSGLAAIGFMYLFKTYTIMFGLSLTTTALITSWVLLNPYSKIYVFHSFPIQIAHLAAAFLLVKGLSLLSDEQYPEFFTTLVSVVFSYLYSLVIWKCNSPFKNLHKFENVIINFFRFNVRKKKASIFDIDEERKNRNFF